MQPQFVDARWEGDVVVKAPLAPALVKTRIPRPGDRMIRQSDDCAAIEIAIALPDAPESVDKTSLP